MIIKPIYTAESINDINIESYDNEVLEYLVSKYGTDIVFESMNEAGMYYGTGGNFDRTGGSKVSGVSGFLQALPSFAITTAISWPVTLIAALGAITHRIKEKYEDKNSWLNRLNPMFWVDYLATPSKSKSSSGSVFNSSSSSKSSSKSEKTWKERVHDALFGAGSGAVGAAGTVAAASLLSKDSSVDDLDSSTVENLKETAINAILVPYWVTLSNGEIIRVKADSDESAKIMANAIIAYTKKPCYERLNERIEKGSPRYKFYFDDGECCYWSADSQKKAYEEATKTRKDLCKVMNSITVGETFIDPLDEPKLDGKVEVTRGKKIQLPEQNKFLNVTTVQPTRTKDSSKKLPKPLYEYAGLYHYKASYANFMINIPAYSSAEASDIVILFNKINDDPISEIYDRMDKTMMLYRVFMKDGDIYVIPGKTVNDVSEIAMELYKGKMESINKTLQDAALEDYENFIKEYGSYVSGVKDVKKIDPEEGKDYKIKKGDVARLVKIVKDDKPVKYPDIRLA